MITLNHLRSDPVKVNTDPAISIKAINCCRKYQYLA